MNAAVEEAELMNDEYNMYTYASAKGQRLVGLQGIITIFERCHAKPT